MKLRHRSWRARAVADAAVAAIATAGAMAMSLPAQAAASLQFNVVAAERFTDIGHDDRDTREQLKALEQHLRQQVERDLPDAQTLRIELLDVDRAGTLRMVVGWPNLIRVMRGTADWPRIRLRYTLSDGERVVAQGEDTVQAMDYLDRLVPYSTSDPLRHEKRMLDRWFVQRFVAQAKAG